jgi:starch phosphorylase
LIQEMVLGVGGWHVLKEMGIDPEVCHLNEGHAAFVVLIRAFTSCRRTTAPLSEALWATRAGTSTLFTPPEGEVFDQFDPDLVRKYANYYADIVGLPHDEMISMGRRSWSMGRCCSARLSRLRECSFVNGVSRLHGRMCKRIFQSRYPRWPEKEVPVGYVTNGVHVPTWDSPVAEQLWAKACPINCMGDYTDVSGEITSRFRDSDIWSFRAEARRDLVEYVRRRHARQLQEHGAYPAEIRPPVMSWTPTS